VKTLRLCEYDVTDVTLKVHRVLSLTPLSTSPLMQSVSGSDDGCTHQLLDALAPGPLFLLVGGYKSMKAKFNHN
jgi:hypothetical protein